MFARFYRDYREKDWGLGVYFVLKRRGALGSCFTKRRWIGLRNLKRGRGNCSVFFTIREGWRRWVQVGEWFMLV